MSWKGVVDQYRSRMDTLPEGCPAVTLLEGNTPLIEAPRLAGELGLNARIYLK